MCGIIGQQSGQRARAWAGGGDGGAGAAGTCWLPMMRTAAVSMALACAQCQLQACSAHATRRRRFDVAIYPTTRRIARRSLCEMRRTIKHLFSRIRQRLYHDFALLTRALVCLRACIRVSPGERTSAKFCAGVFFARPAVSLHSDGSGEHAPTTHVRRRDIDLSGRHAKT